MRVLFAAALCAALSTGAEAAPKPGKGARPIAPRSAPAAPHRVSPTGVLLEADLAAIAKLKADAGDDQFSKDPTVAYIGREFSLMMKSGFNIDYDTGSKTLNVALYDFDDSVILAKEMSAGQYVGQNGYGAKANIRKFRGCIFGVWLPGDQFMRLPIVYKANLDGPAARSLSAALQLRLSGIITRSCRGTDKRSAVYESALTSNATVANPNDILVDGYYVCVALTKAEWIDGRTGAMIETLDLKEVTPVRTHFLN